MEPLSKVKQKWIRSLQLKKNREAEGVFVVEGEKIVLEGLEIYNQHIKCLVVVKDHIELLVGVTNVVIHTVSATEMQQISSLTSPNKLLAVFEIDTINTTEKNQSNGISIALDGIQDPGNMGTILRLADWFGIATIYCSNETVDCYNPKVIQASMGAIFRVSVVYTDIAKFLSESKQPVYAAVMEGENYSTIDYANNGILVFGNEGNGISDEVLSLVSTRITIPRIGQAESLNVATAAAIVLGEVFRKHS